MNEAKPCRLSPGRRPVELHQQTYSNVEKVPATVNDPWSNFITRPYEQLSSVEQSQPFLSRISISKSPCIKFTSLSSCIKCDNEAISQLPFNPSLSSCTSYYLFIGRITLSALPPQQNQVIDGQQWMATGQLGTANSPMKKEIITFYWTRQRW